ncbi:NAD(P)-dependent oxidoreductase [Paenibacillus ferrarius]|uniref:NAD(P)-dependent oxidoreductase n=1 Tax=Paenibacillus ferrarius TaxID=1469647 RepID=UPI003D2CAABB
MKLLHIGEADSRFPTEGPFLDALREFGELTVIRNDGTMTDEEMASHIRAHDVLLTIWGSSPVPEQIAQNPGRLSYICNISGGIKGWIPLSIIEAGIPVTNWGDAIAADVAEAAFTLLLASLKELLPQQLAVRSGGWHRNDRRVGMMYGLRIGIYGMGVIGRKFVDFLRPFECHIHYYDPYLSSTTTLEGCKRYDGLVELAADCDVLVIHAGLTEETRNSVNAEVLSHLADYSIVINTARGDIIDQDALFAELQTGRLRAGLDVIADHDRLADDHPARMWPNVLFTAHDLFYATWNMPKLQRYERICLDNLQRFRDGQPLLFKFDRNRYLRST